MSAIMLIIINPLAYTVFGTVVSYPFTQWLFYQHIAKIYELPKYLSVDSITETNWPMLYLHYYSDEIFGNVVWTDVTIPLSRSPISWGQILNTSWDSE